MGVADLGIEQGGGGCLYLGTDLLVGNGIVHTVQVRDIGPDTAHEEGVGRIPPQGGLQADGVATAEGAERMVVLAPV